MSKTRKYICYSPKGKRVETDYLNYCDLVNHCGYLSSPKGGEDETADTRLERAEDAAKAAKVEASAAREAAGKTGMVANHEEVVALEKEEEANAKESKEDEIKDEEGPKKVSSVDAMQAEMLEADANEPKVIPVKGRGRPSKK